MQYESYIATVGRRNARLVAAWFVSVAASGSALFLVGWLGFACYSLGVAAAWLIAALVSGNGGMGGGDS